jgi:hypothetical protein
MLPVKPFSSQQLKKVLGDLDTHWIELLKSEKSAAKYLEMAREDKFVLQVLKECDIVESNHDRVFKVAIILLFKCLGPLITKKLMEYQASAVLSSACNVAINFDLTDPELSLANTMVITTLCEVSLTAHSSDQVHYCVNMLNYLPLPLYIHQAVIANVSGRVEGRLTTRH